MTEAGDIILLHGYDNLFDALGVFVSAETVLMCKRYSVVKRKLSDFKNAEVTISRLKDRNDRDAVLEYFAKCGANYRLFRIGLKALLNKDLDFFRDPFLMPKLSPYDSSDDYEAAWQFLMDSISPHDCLMMYNRKSLISKVIKSIDGGSWSHSGIYLGEGMIFEGTASGFGKNKIESYKSPNIHVGVYRWRYSNGNENQAIKETIDSFLGKRYSYAKAVFLGIRTMFHMNDDPKGTWDSTPNGLVYSGMLRLITYV